MANGKPVVKPASDGVVEIKVGERTVEIKPEYLDAFVRDVQAAKRYVARVTPEVAHPGGINIPPPTDTMPQ